MINSMYLNLEMDSLTLLFLLFEYKYYSCQTSRSMKDHGMGILV